MLKNILQPLFDFFDSRNTREQLILLIGVPISLLLLVFLLVTKPLLDERTELTERLDSETNFSLWFQQHQQLLSNTNRGAFDWQNQSLPSLIESSIRQDQLATWQSRIYQNRNEQMVINFDAIPYSRLTGWLTRIQNDYQVSIVRANFSATDKQGLVNAEVTLGKPTDSL